MRDPGRATACASETARVSASGAGFSLFGDPHPRPRGKRLTHCVPGSPARSSGALAQLSQGPPPALPNMPGFRTNKAAGRATKQTLKLVHGHMIVQSRPVTAPDPSLLGGTMTMSSAALRTTSPTRGVDAAGYYDLGGRYSIRSQSRDRSAKVHHLPYGPSQLPNFLKFDRKARADTPKPRATPTTPPRAPSSRPPPPPSPPPAALAAARFLARSRGAAV